MTEGEGSQMSASANGADTGNQSQSPEGPYDHDVAKQLNRSEQLQQKISALEAAKQIGLSPEQIENLKTKSIN